MSTRTEERLKQIINEYFSEKQEQLNNNTLGLVVWAGCFGYLLSLLNILPLIIGIFIGIYIGKKQYTLVDTLLSLIISKFNKINMLKLD
jgi:ABC-type dipeptide/oligopeptide/nickel transport system permease component